MFLEAAQEAGIDRKREPSFLMVEGQNCGLGHTATYHEERKRKHQQFLCIGRRKGHGGGLRRIELDRRLQLLAGLSDAACSLALYLASDALGR